MLQHYAFFATTALAAGVAHAEPTSEIFFEFDSSALPAQLPDFEPYMTWLDDNPMGRLVLAGHADPRGTEAYNVGLSARRAESVREALVTRGFDAGRIVLALYGEEGEPRETYAEQRRVTIIPADRPLHTIVDQRLGHAVALVWAEPVTLAELEGPEATTVGTR